jgi:hypothetical protein
MIDPTSVEAKLYKGYLPRYVAGALYLQDLNGLATATLSLYRHRWQNGLVCPSLKSGVAGSNPTRLKTCLQIWSSCFKLNSKQYLSLPRSLSISPTPPPWGIWELGPDWSKMSPKISPSAGQWTFELHLPHAHSLHCKRQNTDIAIYLYICICI